MNENTNDYDSPWKDILETYLEDFLRFFFPLVAKDTNWEKGYTFLDKELQKVVRDAELGKRYADKLVRVWRKDGQETWVLIHIEIQGYEEDSFAKRMYVYKLAWTRIGEQPFCRYNHGPSEDRGNLA